MRRSYQVALVFCGVLLTGVALAQDAPNLTLKVGDVAPDFSLKDQSGKDVSLHDFRGKKNVALAFVVFAFTGG